MPRLPTETREPAQGQQQIRRRSGDEAFSYADLRERGIARVQALSGELWTDYNPHDPGVTLLEALCFALTEGVFGAQMPITDLLTAPDGRIQYRRHGLHGPEEILPCRPTTETDWQRWILDRVPQICHLSLKMQKDGQGRANGLWQMAIQSSRGADGSVAREAARAFWAQRNLGEDLAGLPLILTPRPCSLRLEMEIAGSRDLTDILAELVQVCAAYIDAAPRRQPLRSRAERGGAPQESLAPSDPFEGPRMSKAWIAPEDLVRAQSRRLFFSDLAHAVQNVEGVADIRHLSLSAEGIAESGGALPWNGEDWILQLAWPESVEAFADWRITRRGSRLSIDGPALLRRLAESHPLGYSCGGAWEAESDPAAGLSRPTGQYLPPSPYFPAFKQLPPIYQDPGEGSDPSDRAQFIAYQALLEQWLAHGSAQLQHLRQLYSIGPAPARSYWWQTLDSSHLPDLDPLYAEGGAQRALSAFERADDAQERRGRILDHLLALHGEQFEQNAVRSFGWYYGPRAWSDHLFECKRQLLLRIVRHTRDRQGGIDYSRPSLGRKGNTATLQERVSLQLGFAYAHSRLLLPPLKRYGITLDSAAHADREDEAPADLTPLSVWMPLRRRIVELFEGDLAAQRIGARLAHYFPRTAWQALQPALLRCAVHADRYWLSERDPLRPLWLGPDENGGWWPLELRAAPGSPEAPALYLHELACRMQREGEGLHLVEHPLLKPLADGASAQGRPPSPEADDFFSQRISCVFPAWTARGANPAFRGLAQELVARHCPAHIEAQLLWLDERALLRFEQAYKAWLDARQAYCSALCAKLGSGSAEALAELDRRAGLLVTLLRDARSGATRAAR